MRPMRNASRPFRGLAHWLALFAVLSQALLPVAHAQLMARADGHPLALLACGLGSADFVDALEDVLPPELLAAQAEDGANGTSSAYEVSCLRGSVGQRERAGAELGARWGRRGGRCPAAWRGRWPQPSRAAGAASTGARTPGLIIRRSAEYLTHAYPFSAPPLAGRDC